MGPGRIVLVLIGIFGMTMAVLMLSDDGDDRDPVVYADRTMCGLSPSRQLATVHEHVDVMIVDHSGGASCNDLKSCCRRVLAIQRTDMERHGLPDVRYNFLVGGDGVLYEGRGFELANDISPKTMSVAFIGDFGEARPTEEMMLTVEWLALFGSQESRIDPVDLLIVCYNQLRGVPDQRTDDSQLCRSLRASDKVKMYYQDGTFLLDGENIKEQPEDGTKHALTTG